MKKILIMTSYMSGHGGVEKIIQRMYEWLDHDFETISLSDGVYDENKLLPTPKKFYNWLPKGKIKYLRIKFKGKIINTFLHVIYMFFFLFRKEYDIIIATGPMQCKYMAKILKLTLSKTKLYAWPHFSATSGFGDFSLFSHADKILCISKGISQQLENIGIEEGKLNYFPNPFSKLDETIKINSGTFHYVGRLQMKDQKNLLELMEAMKLTHEKVTVTLIGDGEDLPKIEEYINQHSLSNKILINKGWQNNPWENVKESRGLLLTSTFEGLPTVIGEALSLGVPCISSNCETGPEDFIINKVNGFLYTMGNKEELASCINSIYDGEISFCQDKIKSTMENFYIENYKIRFDRIIDQG